MTFIKNNISAFILLLFVCSLTGCTERIDIELDETYERLVVEGEITTETKAHTVKLTKTTAYFYNEAPPVVTNADVSITDGENIFILTEVEPGIYQTNNDVKGVIGKTYTLNIKNAKIGDKNQNYSASETIRAAWVFDSISNTPMPDDPFAPETSEKDSNEYLILGWGTEPSTPGDYYLWNYYRNDTILSDTISKKIFLSDEGINGNYINGLPMFSVKALKNDTIKIQTKTISKDYYNFIIDILLETVYSSGPFGGPPANIKGNISNGGLGFFNACDINYEYTIVKK